MTDASQFLIPRGFRFGAAKAGLKKSGRTDFALIVADAAGQRRRRLHRQPRHRRAAASSTRTSPRHRRAVSASSPSTPATPTAPPARRASTPLAPPAPPPRKPSPASPKKSSPLPPASSACRCPRKNSSPLCPRWPHRSAPSPTTSSRSPQAIITTDTGRENRLRAHRIASHDGKAREVRIAALGKGSGMIHPQLVPHATMLVYILTDAAIEPAVLDAIFATPSRSASIASPSMAIPPPTTPCCCSPPAPAALKSAPATPQFAAALNAGLHFARPPDCCRRRRRHPRCRAAHRRRSHRRRRTAESPRPSRTRRWSRPPGPAAIPTGAVLSPPSATPAQRSIPTASTSGSAICPSAATAAAPRNSTKPPPTPTSQQPRVLHRHPAPPRLRLLRLLDHRPDRRIHPHQRRLLHLVS